MSKSFLLGITKTPVIYRVTNVFLYGGQEGKVRCVSNQAMETKMFKIRMESWGLNILRV